MTYIVSIESRDVATGADDVLRYGTSGVYHGGDDAYYEPRLSNPGNYERHMFGAGTTWGESTVGAGEIVLRNEDGACDQLRRRAYGRPAEIRRLLADGTSTVALRGVVEQPTVSWTELVFRFRDALEALRKPLQTRTYAGTTTHGGMGEALGSADLKDKPLPISEGRAFSVQPVPANAFDLVFQVNDGWFDDLTLYDLCVPLTVDPIDYPTLVQLLAAEITPGHARTCKALGLFRLRSKPTDLRADVTVGATAGARSAGQIAKRLFLRFASAHPELDLELVAGTAEALDARNNAEVQLWIDAERNALDALVEVLGSIGATIVPDRLGRYRFVRFEAPIGTAPALDLDHTDIAGEDGAKPTPALPEDEGRGVPAQEVVIGYARCWATQTGANVQAGPCVSDEHRSFVAQEFREVVVKADAATLAAYPNGPKLRWNTLLINKADAEAEAARRRALYGVPREILPWTCPAGTALAADLGDTVRTTLPRFGLAAGRNWRLIGIAEDFLGDQTTLTLWS